MYFPFASAPILYVTPRNAAGYGRGRSENLSLCRNEKYHFQFSPLLISFVMSWERGRSHSVFVIEGLEVKIILTDFLLCRGGGAVAVL